MYQFISEESKGSNTFRPRFSSSGTNRERLLRFAICREWWDANSLSESGLNGKKKIMEQTENILIKRLNFTALAGSFETCEETDKK